MTARAACACALACLLVVGATAGSASADVPVSQVGWWTRALSPPTVPEGGIGVGAAPDGDLTVGAVLLDAGDGASGVGLRLVETGGQGQALASLVVCPTTTSWSAAAGGPMAEAPPADQCEATSAPMTRAADGTWTADVAFANGQSGPVALLVKPAPGAVAFQLSFAPPTVTGTVSTPSPGGGAAEEPASRPATSPRPSSTPSFVQPPSSPATAAVPVSVVAAPMVAGTDAATSIGASSAEVAVPVFGSVPAGGGDDDSGVSRLTIVSWYVLALVVGATVAALTWVRNEGRLSLEGLATFVRLRR